MTEAQIRSVLLADWDPFGIGRNVNVADEYDRYIPEIAEAIRQASSPADIERVLLKVETYLHAPIFDDYRLQVANRLFAMRSQ